MSLAIFDLDNTLLSGDSDYLWGVYLSEKGIVDADIYKAKNQQFFDDYKNGTLDIEAFHTFSMQPLAKNNPKDLYAWREDFMLSKIQPLIGQAALDLVEQHRARGDTLLIITATNTFVTRPIADKFGIDNLIGTEPEQVDGRYTGKMAGVSSFREGKITRLMAWLKETGETLEGACFYSDSHNDLPLLELVEKAIVVDPDEKLLAHAEANGWPVMSLRES